MQFGDDSADIVECPAIGDNETTGQTAGITHDSRHFDWGDESWMRERDALGTVLNRPMSIYEVHLGSWKRMPEDADRPLTYRELGPQLADYATMRGLEVPEWSHLSRRDAARFTRAYVEVLGERDVRLRTPPVAEPAG